VGDSLIQTLNCKARLLSKDLICVRFERYRGRMKGRNLPYKVYQRSRALFIWSKVNCILFTKKSDCNVLFIPLSTGNKFYLIIILSRSLLSSL
jgi:hypothetical protein